MTLKYLLLFFPFFASAAFLSPYDVQKYNAKWMVDANVSTYTQCPEIIPAVININVESIYTSDPCKCVIDPEKQSAYLEAVENGTEYAKLVVRLADQFVTSDTLNPSIAACALSHIDHWAASYALLGDINGSSGVSSVTNILAPVAQSFLKIENAQGLDSIKIHRIKLWMKNIARLIVSYQTYHAGSNTQQNNHRYWDAFAVLSAALVADDNELFLWANDSLNVGLSQIIQHDTVDANGIFMPEGSLPLEIERGDSSYAYHVFALSPLIALSEMIHMNVSEHNLTSPYARYNNALFKLVTLIIKEEERYFLGMPTALAGVKEIACHQAAWAEIMMRRNARISKYENAPLLARFIQNKRMSDTCGGRLYYTLLGGFTTYSFGIYNLDQVIEGIQ